MQSLNSPSSEWKIYGNFRRTCWGKIYIHPVRPWWWALEIYTIIGICIFAVEYNKFPPWQLAIGLALGCFTIFSSFKTILSDPGICPRPPYEEALENRQRIKDNPSSNRKTGVRRGCEVQLSYCYKCHMYRPPSTGHCSVCDCCIEGWDHHCPVFGGCIGYKNKCWFFCMALLMPIFWVYLLVSGSISSVMADVNDKWYNNKTLCCAISGFVGAFILPPFIGCFKCCSCDDVHTRPIPRSRSNYGLGFRTGDLSKASYPRQPPSPLPRTIKKKESEQENSDQSNHNSVV